MSGLTRATAVGTTLVAALALIVGTYPAEGAAKAKDTPAKAKAAPKPVKGTLAADAKLTSTQLAAHIDKLIDQQLKAEKVDASPLADDAEFLRRAYLDITGKIPTREKATAFLDSKDADKRAKLIDELLESKDYGKHQADLWQALLLPKDSDSFRIRRFFPAMVKWLEDGFNDNKAWDKLTKDLLTSTGEVDKGPTVYYLANQSVDKMTDNVTKVFLGVQLQCAQCHNHPFTDWKQTEYWGMAAFFTKVRTSGNPRQAQRGGATPGINEGPTVNRNRRTLPESAKILPPKFFGAEEPKIKASDPYRPVLADWLTSAKNPYFSKAMVNRTWGQFFGRGFVAPVDDMHDGNSASHPELLADVAGQFAANDFDVKYLIRALCNSKAYQRTSKPKGNNSDAGPELFARMAIKPMMPEQLYDSLIQVVGPPARGARGPAAGGFRGPTTPRDAFVAFFSADEGADPLEYQSGIPQVLQLMNAGAFNNAAALKPILADSKDAKEITEKLYLTTLSRRPTAEDHARIAKYLDKHKGASAKPSDKLWADVMWALINCSEFSLNH